jgi:hypothetical protein
MMPVPLPPLLRTMLLLPLPRPALASAPLVVPMLLPLASCGSGGSYPWLPLGSVMLAKKSLVAAGGLVRDGDGAANAAADGTDGSGVTVPVAAAGAAGGAAAAVGRPQSGGKGIIRL